MSSIQSALSGPTPHPEVFVHFDSDDLSHPNRIAEQVAFLQSSGADVVGYNQMLFWNDQFVEFDRSFGDGGFGAVTETEDDITIETGELVKSPGEAWLYTGPAHCPLGTSLCYWARTWKAHRFDDRKNAGEDTDFLHRVGHRRVKSVSSVDMPETAVSGCSCHGTTPCLDREHRWEPRMVATVHGQNTQQATYDGFFRGGAAEMRRAPEWDERVRKVISEA